MIDSENKEVMSDEKVNERIAELDFLLDNYRRKSKEASSRAADWRFIEQQFDNKITEANRERSRIQTGSLYAQKFIQYPFSQVQTHVAALNIMLIGFEHKRFLSKADWEEIKAQIKITKLWLHRYIAQL